MDIQAYFEEWSRRPGDVVQLALSTPHKAVRASLEKLLPAGEARRTFLHKGSRPLSQILSDEGAGL